jgi:NAD(P)H-nitrite reductase large subunit
MELDDDLCVCFHVSKRKVINFLQVHRPAVVTQLSECQGAGTGCGWCRPYLEKLFQASQQQQSPERLELPDAADYARRRAEYRRNKS